MPFLCYNFIMITVQDFKEYFYRDFPYLPIYDENTVYNTGNIVYYTNKFYSCKKDDTIGELPTNTTYWQDAKADIYDYILDSDITKAIGEMLALLPSHLFTSDVILNLAQLYLTAHCLCNDIKTSNAGLASQIIFPVSSKSAGGISESYGVPRKFLDNETYAFYITSQYGLKYLAMLIPRLRGNIAVVAGWTQP